MMKTLCILGLIPALALAGCDGMTGGGSYSQADAKAGAAFRFHARDVVAGLNPKCPFTENPQMLAEYDGVKERFVALKESIAGRSLETDLIAVESDYDHFWSVNPLECAPVDGDNVQEQVAQEVARVSSQLEQLERIAGGI